MCTGEPRSAVQFPSSVVDGDVLSIRSICDNIRPLDVSSRARARLGGERDGRGWSARIVQPSGDVEVEGERESVT
jgi:hypothetical protein